MRAHQHGVSVFPIPLFRCHNPPLASRCRELTVGHYMDVTRDLTQKQRYSVHYLPPLVHHWNSLWHFLCSRTGLT
jgi:hypothetical protein